MPKNSQGRHLVSDVLLLNDEHSSINNVSPSTLQNIPHAAQLTPRLNPVINE